MVLCIKDNGKIISNMEKDNISFLMAHSMKVTGKIICFTEQDFILIHKVENGKANSEMADFNRKCKNN